MTELLLRRLLLDSLRHAGHTRHFFQHTTDTTHIVHLLQLIAKIGQIKALALLHFPRQSLGLTLVDFALGLFNQRHHVAHAENARGDALGVEGLQRSGLLANTHKFNRLASDGAHRQRRTTTGVRVDLGENDAAERQHIIKCLRRIGRILTGHGVDDKQCFGGLEHTV